MDLLKAEIAKKRNYLESTNLIGEKKYFKRSALRQKEEEEYFAKSKRAKDIADDSAESSLLEKVVHYLKYVLYLNYLILQNEEENLLLKKFEERSREEREKSKLMPRKEVDDAEDEESYVSSRVKAGSDSTHSGEPSALDVKTKENVLSESDIETMKLDLARYVVYREGTATDDATATVVSISKLTPVTITGELESDFRNTVTDHALRYLKVS
ncbi:unnamed protein product [Echinostoma caproni]|uniref:Neuroguidin n=1 Tax=Echinostoma caproni TaxID=27848 RepID=A0A183B8S9_9TREM|nr:unnamed protein product [Echinostoma caproni]